MKSYLSRLAKTQPVTAELLRSVSPERRRQIAATLASLHPERNPKDARLLSRIARV